MTKSFTCISFRIVSPTLLHAVFTIAILLVLATTSAFAISISSPGDGAQVSSPFTLAANAASCASQSVSAMGYSLDGSPNTSIVDSQSISTQVSAAPGAHVLHVKAWGNRGGACNTDVNIIVEATPASGIVVSSPANGAEITLPYALSAHASGCAGQPVGAMGFSLDGSANTAISNGTSIATEITAGTGRHTLHVKSWGPHGAACHEDVTVNVVQPTAINSSSQPISVMSPGNGQQVSSPFELSADASTCSSQAVNAMGYSLDNSPTTIVSGTSLGAQVSAPEGPHTLHVKSWGKNGAGCMVDVAIDVTAGTALSVVPSDAIRVSNIQALGNWTEQFDTGTGGGSASGSMSMVGSPSQTGHARKFSSSFWGYGGERFYASFGDDTTSTHFFYDAWIYLDGSVDQIANLELDMNQTMPNGQTAIFGFQCDGWSNTWDYTGNKGTPQNPIDVWIKSNQHCNVRTWSRYTWHHVQVLYERDDWGNITYQSVWLDGKEQTINARVNSAFALGWAPSLLTNVQVDELSSGWSSADVYIDDITVYRW